MWSSRQEDAELPLHGKVERERIWAEIVVAATALADGWAINCIGTAGVIIQHAFSLSELQLALFFGVTPFGMIPGASVGGWLADQIGRRYALCISYVVLIVGALMMSLANGFAELIVGRILESLAIGAGLTISLTYVSEVSSSTDRGQRSGLLELFISVGSLFGALASALILGASNDWRWILVCGAAIPGILLLMLLSGFAPESPRYLLMAGKPKDAEFVLRKLVGEEEAQRTLRNWQMQPLELKTWSETLCPSKAPQQKALIMSVAVMLFQMMTGITWISAYSTTMFAEDMSIELSFRYSLFVSIAKTATCCAILPYIDEYGRRPLLLFSYAGTIVGIALLALSYRMSLSAMPWKLVGYVIFGISYEIGMGPVSWVYSSEVLDSGSRSKGVAFAIIVQRLYSGLSTTALIVTAGMVGVTPCFVGLLVINILGFIYLYFNAPETAKLPLEEISKVFD